jgi:ribonuclease P protein component
MPFFIERGGAYVVYVPATLELEEETRARLQETDEHEAGAKGSSSTAGEGTREVNGVIGMPPRSADLLFLRSHSDIERVKRNGRRFETPLFNLVSSTSASSLTQICIVVSKRFGGAVERNRAKRRFRELAREIHAQFVRGRHIVIFPRRKALSVTHPCLRETWLSALQQEGLLDSGQNVKG